MDKSSPEFEQGDEEDSDHLYTLTASEDEQEYENFTRHKYGEALILIICYYV